MRVENIIIDCLKKNIVGLCVDDVKFLDGIQEYASDNKINLLLNEEQTFGESEFLVSSFLDSFYRMPVDVVNDFFKNYSLIKEFKLISNTIRDLATKKFKTNETVVLEEKVEKHAIECIAKMYSNGEIANKFASEISDVFLEIDYIKEKTDKLSIRLTRMAL